jgi:iron complex outermembrane receptor protein
VEKPITPTANPTFTMQNKIIKSLMCVQVLAVTSYAQPAEEPAEVELEELSIIGQGQTLSTMTLSTKDLSKSVSAVNPLDSLNRLPGVNFAGSDAMGFYEYGQNFSLRIFQKNQVAVTVDGVPLNSQDPAGGSPAGRFLDMESLSSITVSQGSGDLSTASNYGLGGRIDFTTGTPKDSMALQTDYTVGSESLQRGNHSGTLT